EETSPPAIIDDLVIVGSAIGDNTRSNEPTGVVRAFDARSGELRWSWSPIPRNPEDPAAKTWADGSALKTGAANVWSIISVDPQNALFFLPVSSASPDYYGGMRVGDNVYSDSLVALHAKTGELAWYFQTTHHDLWDYDNPAMPLLCTIRKHGKEIPAVVQGTARQPFHLQSDHGRAGLSDRGTSGAADGCSWRADLAHAAVPDAAAADCPGKSPPRRCVGRALFRSPLLSSPDGGATRRGHLHAAVDQRLDADSEQRR